MSIKINVDECGSLALDEFIEQLEQANFDPADQQSYREVAPLLKALSNNKSFLADYVMRELEEDLSNIGLENNYVPQVILLSLDQKKQYMIRANFWPSENDFVYGSSGASAFSYGLGHDHNFNFLTVGYLGPGYRTDLYEYDHDSVAGFVGEVVDLKYCGEEYLRAGDVMLYRAHKDVHVQHPPESMSISLNLVEINRNTAYKNQYEFDIRSSKIKSILGENRLQALIYSAAMLEPEGSEQILKDISSKHSNERLRFEAIKARASNCKEHDSSLKILDEGLMSSSRMVRESCKQYKSILKENSIYIGAESNELRI